MFNTELDIEYSATVNTYNGLFLTAASEILGIGKEFLAVERSIMDPTFGLLSVYVYRTSDRFYQRYYHLEKGEYKIDKLSPNLREFKQALINYKNQ